REAGHSFDQAEVLGTPADEIPLGIVILQLETRLEPLNLGLLLVQVLLVAIDHGSDDDFFIVVDGGDGIDELLYLARVRAQHERFAVAHAPPFAAGIGLVPVVADARLTGAAIVEEDRNLARLGPFHRVLPFARMETTFTNVVPDLVGRMFALEILDLAI